MCPFPLVNLTVGETGRQQLTCPAIVSPTGQVKPGRSWGAVSGDARLGPTDREMGGTEERAGDRCKHLINQVGTVGSRGFICTKQPSWDPGDVGPLLRVAPTRRAILWVPSMAK